jgi:sulfatase maturation enzyme AslB (radical SAM superfamily)
MQKRQPDSEIVIGLSLDGLEEKLDRLRGEPGNWQQVWKTFEQIRELGGKISIKVTTVISNMNFGEILPLMRQVLRHGADFLRHPSAR